jgi:hypothetical protein
MVMADDSISMGYYCPRYKGMTFVPKIEGLNLPVVLSKKCHKKKQQERQQKLF